MSTASDRDLSLAIGGEDWIGQTIIYSRALAAVCLLAGGAVLAFADWNVVGMPAQFYMGLVWAVPSIAYFSLSFFVRRRHGRYCVVLFCLAGLHAVAVLFSPLLLGGGMIAAAVPPITVFSFAEAMPFYFLLIFALMAGMGNLMAAAFWARKWISEPHFLSRVRGFEVMVASGGSN
jgi:hypothetical protein